MEKSPRYAARATLLCLACVVPALAGAQSPFFVRVVGAPDTIACAPDSVVASGGTFALTWNVPASELDANVEGRVNGNLVFATPLMLPGASGSVPGNLDVSFAPVSFPYTFTVRVTSGVAGIAPTGISFFCPAAGPGTNFTILSEAAEVVPALSLWGLVWTGALVVMAGAAMLRRRASMIS